MPLLAGHNKYYLLWLLSASRHLRLAMRHVTVVTQLSPPPSPTTTTTPDAERIWCRQIVSNFFFFINVMSNYDCSAHSLWHGSVLENDIKDVRTQINEIIGWCSLYFLFSSIHRSLGVKESDTGLASPNLWDLAADRQRMGEEHPLQPRFGYELVGLVYFVYWLIYAHVLHFVQARYSRPCTATTGSSWSTCWNFIAR